MQVWSKSPVGQCGSGTKLPCRGPELERNNRQKWGEKATSQFVSRSNRRVDWPCDELTGVTIWLGNANPRGIFQTQGGLQVWRLPNRVPGFDYVSPTGGRYCTVSGHLSETDSRVVDYKLHGSTLKQHDMSCMSIWHCVNYTKTVTVLSLLCSTFIESRTPAPAWPAL